MSPSRTPPLFLGVVLTLFLSRPSISQSILATQCYYKSDSTLHTSPGGPCGIVTPTSNFTTCCAIGDTCLDSGLCHYTHAQPTSGSSTGYYVGGCTDQSYESTSCQPACSDLDLTDVVYNSTTGTWHCCGSTNGVVHCNNPTTETFDAPALNKLSVSYSVPSTVVTAAASSSTSSTASTTSSSETSATTGRFPSTTATSTSAASSTSSSTPNSHSGISSGAKVGFGVGISCAVVVIGISAAFFLYHRKRKSNKRMVSGAAYGKAESGSPPVSDYNIGNAHSRFYAPGAGEAKVGMEMGDVKNGGASTHGAVEVPGGFAGSELQGEEGRRFHEASNAGARNELDSEVPGRRGGKSRSGVYEMA